MFKDESLNEILEKNQGSSIEFIRHLDSVSHDIKKAEQFLSNMPISANVSVSMDDEYDLMWCVEQKRICITEKPLKPLIECKVGLRLKGFSVMKHLMEGCFNQMKLDSTHIRGVS